MSKFRDILSSLKKALFESFTVAPEGDKKTERLKKRMQEAIDARQNARQAQVANKHAIPSCERKGAHVLVDSNRTRKLNRYSFNQAEMYAIEKRLAEANQRFSAEKSQRELAGFKHAKAI